MKTTASTFKIVTLPIPRDHTTYMITMTLGSIPSSKQTPYEPSTISPNSEQPERPGHQSHAALIGQYWSVGAMSTQNITAT